jgi:DNA adenine methylase
MYSNKLYTPLRYPGGKARFAPFIGELIKLNGLEGGHYLEPYAGGAGAALELLFDGLVSDIHINDADSAVKDFWLAATKHSDALIDLVENAPVTMDAWYQWRSIMTGEKRAGVVERGFATLFMNRTNRSGILKGGVIGGKAQAGKYTLDVRFLRKQLSERLTRIGQHRKQIHVYGEDALCLLRRSREIIPPKSLIYLDPPYYVKGQGLYRNYYEHADHAAIAKLLKSKSFPRRWLVSYDDVSPIRAIYNGTQIKNYGLNYTAQRRYQGAEVMFFCDRLAIPGHKLAGA